MEFLNRLISINEYGGPRLDRAPVYEKYNFDYALDLSSSAAGTVTSKLFSIY
jgi:hypothetical protein